MSHKKNFWFISKNSSNSRHMFSCWRRCRCWKTKHEKLMCIWRKLCIISSLHILSPLSFSQLYNYYLCAFFASWFELLADERLKRRVNKPKHIIHSLKNIKLLFLVHSPCVRCLLEYIEKETHYNECICNFHCTGIAIKEEVLYEFIIGFHWA